MTARPSLCRRVSDHAVAMMIIVAVVVVWELATRFGLVSPIVLPAPTAVAKEFFGICREIFNGGPLRNDTLVTLYESVAGFVVAFFLAFIGGTLIAEVPLLRRVMMPYLVAINAAPKIALAPLIVVWFGFGTSSKIVMAALIAFFPLLINVISGLANADPQKLKLMHSLAASAWMTFTKVKLPDALPSIFAGMKIAIVFAVVGAVVGEFVGAEAGLGLVIKRTDYQLDVALTFAVVALLSLMGILLFYAVEWSERRMLFWTTPKN